ncbi:MAG: hypothetical protein QNJ18_14585 [Xenococcaceae cyanobacterium MO_167.B52]|nr:hypothetical protein [Xenococcaceae cyanobacterium MO_167.B52]
MTTSHFQDIIDSLESLSVEEQDYLFDLIRKRRVAKRRLEIKQNGEETLQALASGKAKKGTAEDIKAYLLEDEEE